MAIAALTGIGLVSVKSAWMSGQQLVVASARLLVVAGAAPRARARRSCAGHTFETTAITPCAPTAIIGSVRLSSPESTVNLPPVSWMMREI